MNKIFVMKRCEISNVEYFCASNKNIMKGNEKKRKKISRCMYLMYLYKLYIYVHNLVYTKTIFRFHSFVTNTRAYPSREYVLV